MNFRGTAAGLALGLAGLAGLAVPQAATATEALPQRYRAAIDIEQPSAVVRLPLTVQAYARSAPDAHGGLADLRVVDANGLRVPFAVLTPRPDERRPADTWRDARAFPLPPMAAGAEPGLPLELKVDGGRITVRQGGAASSKPSATVPGWVFDLGERESGAAAPHLLRVQWSGPMEFSAIYSLEHSADLKQWRSGGSGGQVMALAAGGAALTQPDVTLPVDVSRFVRLRWSGEGPWPQISAAQAATAVARPVVLDPPQALSVAATPEPAGRALDASSARAWHFDLGAVLPVVKLELQLPGTRVLPAQVQVRNSVDAGWEALAGTVFYRLQREGGDALSPPITLQRRFRYVRLLPDERAGNIPPEGVKLTAQVQLASLVFASQGQPPYALLAGAEKVAIGALPLATLVPEPEQERARFGRASLGAWGEVAEAAKHAEAEALKAQARPWLLWALILAGVAGLGFMVWRLMRGRPAE